MTETRRGPDDRPVVRLPEHEFFYTLDQIALILSVSEGMIKSKVYFSGRMPDAHTRSMLMAINLADADEQPQWRVSSRELTRWLARKGYKPT